jgi:hypothetical protein
VESAVQRCLGGVLPGGQPRLDLLEREGVVAQQCPCRIEIGERRLARLLVPLDRCALAEPRDAVVGQLHLDDIVLVARLAGDHEGLREPEGDDSCVQLHGRNLTRRLHKRFARPTS